MHISRFKKILLISTLCIGLTYAGHVASAADDSMWSPENYNEEFYNNDNWDSTDEVLDNLGITFGSGEEVTSFEGFKGGLTPPSGEGLDPSLTRTSSAREFILTIVNFALGFLGLVAVLIVIYGGVQYVISAGGEGAEKGKKAIIYAIIGIVIILGSYALVNTVLQAPSGTDQGGGANVPGGPVVTLQDLNPFKSKLQGVMKDLVNTYGAYVDINDQLDKATIKAEQTAVYVSSLDNANADTTQKIKEALQNIDARFSNVVSKGKNLSTEQELINALRLFMTAYTDIVSTMDHNVARARFMSLEKVIVGTASADTLSGIDIFAPVAKIVAEKNFDKNEIGIQQMKGRVKKDFERHIDVLKIVISEEVYQPVKDYTEVDGMNVLFTDLVSENVLNHGYTLSALPPFISDDLGLLEQLKGDTLDQARLHLKQIMFIMIQLNDKLKNIKFVKAKITADKLEGSAPLIVNFSSIKSFDPANQSITDNQITWDMDGDGFGITTGQCDQFSSIPTSEKSVTSCTYTQPGVYRVGLKIKSAKEKDVAPGIDYVTVRVNRPKIRIHLKAVVSGNVGGLDSNETELMAYNDEGFIKVDKQQFNVTLSQASNILFDAQGTASGVDLTNTDTFQTIQNLKWDFGDGSEVIQGQPDQNGSSSGGSITQPVHSYTKEGSYRLILEVTDKIGNIDRKIVRINVGRIAAKIDLKPDLQGTLNTSFMLNGTHSQSDLGPITSYDWTVQAMKTPPGITVPEIKMTDPSWEKIFKETGAWDYKVVLKVSDKDGNKSSDDAILKIRSAPPVSKFQVLKPKISQPSTIVLDAFRTFDPDGENKNISYSWIIDAPKDAYQIIKGDLKSQQLQLKFTKKGEYKASLEVYDSVEDTGREKLSKSEQSIMVDKTLDIAWDTMESNKNLANGKASVTFKALSDSGVAYEMDFGDSSEVKKGDFSKTVSIPYVYTTAGTYTAKLTIFDDEDNEISITKKIYIGAGDKPLATISLMIDGVEEQDLSQPAVVNRKNILTFDAGKSINIDGSGRKLDYSWDFGDLGKSTNKIATHTYKDLSPKSEGSFTVTLRVIDKDDPTASAEDTVKINVISLDPEFKALSALPQKAELVTPLKVTVSAIDAQDKDGKIMQYRWWYYDINNPELELGAQLTQSPTATMTIGTKGEEDQEHQYKFGVAVIDNENNSVSSEDILESEDIPTVTVKNGPNKAPIAKFTVDKTNINVGQSITFSSTSSDPDGKIIQFIWDVEGDGFHNNEPIDKPTFTQAYNQSAKDGINVRLKVIDDGGAETISDFIKVYVTSLTTPPKAAFTTKQLAGTQNISFTNNAEADTEHNAAITKATWDFDTSTDSDGDGKKENDTDSGEMDPIFSYKTAKTYMVKLTVYDNEGNYSSITNTVIVTDPNVASAGTLDARLQSQPSTNPFDGKIHLFGETGNITFDTKQSTGSIALFTIDKNILFDTNGNGVKDDDEDYKSTTPGQWTTGFAKSYGKIIVRLTVTDILGKKDTVDKEIIFDTPIGSSSLFGSGDSPQAWIVLAVLGVFAIVGIKVIQKPKKHTKKRTKKSSSHS